MKEKDHIATMADEPQMSGENLEAQMPLMQCPKCGWCHFGVTEAYVRDWEATWATLDESGRECYGLPDGPPKRADSYEKCFRCGNADRGSFFKSTKNLFGHTINPILLTREQEIAINGAYSLDDTPQS